MVEIGPLFIDHSIESNDHSLDCQRANINLDPYKLGNNTLKLILSIVKRKFSPIIKLYNFFASRYKYYIYMNYKLDMRI
jgi:hypothetical protein